MVGWLGNRVEDDQCRSMHCGQVLVAVFSQGTMAKYGNCCCNNYLASVRPVF